MKNGRQPGLLEGKVVFVAGVGPHIGAATALIAAREGARVALTARSAGTAIATAETIRASGGLAIARQCDLSVDEQIRAAVDATVAEFGPIDAVFYNAAFYDNEQTDLVIDEAAWQLSMGVNVRGPMAVARYTIPSMLERGAGAFVFT